MTDSTYTPEHAAPESDSPDTVFSNKWYNRTKWFALTAVPAIVTFVLLAGEVWDIANYDKVGATIAGLGALLGAFLKRENTKYEKSDAKYDGKIVVEDVGEGLKRADLVLKDYENPAEVVNQKEVLFKVEEK